MSCCFQRCAGGRGQKMRSRNVKQESTNGGDNGCFGILLDVMDVVRLPAARSNHLVHDFGFRSQKLQFVAPFPYHDH